MATIAQVSQLGNTRGQALLGAILIAVPKLRFAQFKLDTARYDLYPDRDITGSTSARAINAALGLDTYKPSSASGDQKAYGFEVGIDDLYKGDLNVTGAPAGLVRQLEGRLKRLAVKVAEDVEADTIRGMGTDNSMIGLAGFIKDAAAAGQVGRFGFTQEEIAGLLTQVGFKLDTVENQNLFVEMLMRDIASVPGANAIEMNSSLLARMTTIALRLGAAGETRDSFGKPVTTFNNIPMVPVSNRGIGCDESDGTNTDCTSLYIVRYEEDNGVSISTNSGFKFDDFEEEEGIPAGKSRLQFFGDLNIQNLKCLRRMSRIRL